MAKNRAKKQNYFCNDCGRQFIGDHALIYKGCHFDLNHKILKMRVRGVDILDVSDIENISVK